MRLMLQFGSSRTVDRAKVRSHDVKGVALGEVEDNPPTGSADRASYLLPKSVYDETKRSSHHVSGII